MPNGNAWIADEDRVKTPRENTERESTRRTADTKREHVLERSAGNGVRTHAPCCAPARESRHPV